MGSAGVSHAMVVYRRKPGRLDERTVELLTTGVDVPAVRNIAFFRYMKSPISFYQMIGRGTRIDEPTGKLMFTVYDDTGATRLFGGTVAVTPRSLA
jgi:type I restriction enzyme R subunit